MMTEDIFDNSVGTSAGRAIVEDERVPSNGIARSIRTTTTRTEEILVTKTDDGLVHVERRRPSFSSAIESQATWIDEIVELTPNEAVRIADLLRAAAGEPPATAEAA